MKKKSINKKLSINKQTISDLSLMEKKVILGGETLACSNLPRLCETYEISYCLLPTHCDGSCPNTLCL